MFDNLKRTIALRQLWKFTRDLADAHDAYVGAGQNWRSAAEWYRCAHASMYARAGGSYSQETGAIHMIAIANIIVDPDHRRRGFFSEMLTGMQGIAHERGRHMRVELVGNLDLKAALIRRGYKPETTGLPYSWYLPPPT